MNVAAINGKDYELPEGIHEVTDDGLYWVNLNAVDVAAEYKGEDATDKSIKFFNPRHLGSYTVEVNGKSETYRGQGFDKEAMTELLEDIKAKGLNYPFLCCWVMDGDKVIGVRVIDGERRYRSIKRLIDKNEKVWSESHKQFMPAKEVFSSLLCRIRTMTDEESLQEACEVSETSVPWGAAAQAKLIKILYDKGKTDEDMCKLLRKKPQWVAETHSLTDLDSLTFEHLLSNKINRSVALRLLKVKDVSERQELLLAAWNEAVKRMEKTKEKVSESLGKAESKQALAESRLVEAEMTQKDNEFVEEIQEELSEAADKVRHKQELLAETTEPLVKNKDMDKAATRKGDKPQRCLRPLKIRKQLESIQKMIDEDDDNVCDIDTLKIIACCYNAILEGEQDIVKTLKKAT